ncbi:unnamed protein product [Notodromas monacha]|uniref:Sec16 Sec23-binding domain-containing protein n=1 Tax=Notodromas monacha TaxID=399045 RepID=A0A7R9BEM8_9CRUS|nr:unnamed protein product [Notodromas monacha]CAG0913945.1 unnamed protein product [Notodromas monacha]
MDQEWNDQWDWNVNGNDEGAGGRSEALHHSNAPPPMHKASNVYPQQPRNMFSKTGPNYQSYVQPPANHAAHQFQELNLNPNDDAMHQETDGRFTENWAAPPSYAPEHPITPGGDYWGWGDEDTSVPYEQHPTETPHSFVPTQEYHKMSIPTAFVSYSGFTPANNEEVLFTGSYCSQPPACDDSGNIPATGMESMGSAGVVDLYQDEGAAELVASDGDATRKDGSAAESDTVLSHVNGPSDSAFADIGSAEMSIDPGNGNEQEVVNGANIAGTDAGNFDPVDTPNVFVVSTEDDHLPESEQGVQTEKGSSVPDCSAYFEREGDGYQPADAHPLPYSSSAVQPSSARMPPSAGTSASTISSSSSSASLGVRQETIGEAAGEIDDGGDDGDIDGGSGDNDGEGDGSSGGASFMLPPPQTLQQVPPRFTMPPPVRDRNDDGRFGGPGPERSTPPPRKETIGSESDGLETMGMTAITGAVAPTRSPVNRSVPGGAVDPRRQPPPSADPRNFTRRLASHGVGEGGTSSETDDRLRRGRTRVEESGKETPPTTTPTGGENSAVDSSGGKGRDRRRKDERDRYGKGEPGRTRRHHDEYPDEDRRRRGGRRQRDGASAANDSNPSSEDFDEDDRGSSRHNRHYDRHQEGRRRASSRERRPAPMSSNADRWDRSRRYDDRREYETPSARHSSAMVVAKRSAAAVAPTGRYGREEYDERDRRGRWHGYDDDDDARSRRSRGYSSVYDSRSRPASRSGYPRYDDPYRARAVQQQTDYGRYAAAAGGYPYGTGQGMDPYYMNYAAQFLYPMAQYVAAAATKQLTAKLNVPNSGASINERDGAGLSHPKGKLRIVDVLEVIGEEGGVDAAVIKAGEFDGGNEGKGLKRFKDVPKFSGDHAIGDFLSDGRFLVKYPGQDTLEIFGMCDTVEEIESAENYDSHLVEFPGPLSRSSSKKTALAYCMRMIEDLDVNIASDHILLLEFIVLLIKQNGSMMHSDIAELLVKRCDVEAVSGTLDAPIREGGEGVSGLEARAIAEGQERGMPTARGDGASSTGLSVVDNPQLEVDDGTGEDESLETFYRLMLAGQRSEALDHAVGTGLWGHAALLASKMMPAESGAFERILAAFSESLRPQDPLKTLYHLVLHQTSPNITNWNPSLGDWRSHLAMVIGNCEDDEMVSQTIERMGDNLRAMGKLHASQFCYLVAGSSFGSWEDPGARLVLLGAGRTDSSSSVVNYEDITTNYAIGLTELYEYGMRLSHPEFSIPQLQAFKLIKAERLLDAMKSDAAYDYVAAIGDWIGRTGASGLIDVDGFVEAVLEIAENLKPIGFRRARNRDAPGWLTALKIRARGQPRPERRDSYQVQEQVQNQQRFEHHAAQIQPEPVAPEVVKNEAHVDLQKSVDMPVPTAVPQMPSLPEVPAEPVSAPAQVLPPPASMGVARNPPSVGEITPWSHSQPQPLPAPVAPLPNIPDAAREPVQPMMVPGVPQNFTAGGFHPGGMTLADVHPQPGFEPNNRAYRSGSVEYWDPASAPAVARKRCVELPAAVANYRCIEEEEEEETGSLSEESVSSQISVESDRQSVSSASTLAASGHLGAIGAERRKNSSGDTSLNSSRNQRFPPSANFEHGFPPPAGRSGMRSQRPGPVGDSWAGNNFSSLPPMPTLSERPANEPMPGSHKMPHELSEDKKHQQQPAKNGDISQSATAPSWIKKIVNKLVPNAPNQMILPDDSQKSIIWDDKLKKWVNQDSNGAETEASGPIAPPKDFELPGGPPSLPPQQPSFDHGAHDSHYHQQSLDRFPEKIEPTNNETTLASPTNLIHQGSRPQSQSTPKSEASSNAPPAPAENRFKRKGGRLGYVDVLNPNKSADTSSSKPVVKSPAFPANVFIPPPPEPTTEALDFVSRPGEETPNDENFQGHDGVEPGNFMNPEKFRGGSQQPASRPMGSRYPTHY